MARHLPDQATLFDLLDYDPASGILRWKPRDNPNWNKSRNGAEAVRAINRHGYKQGMILGMDVRAHLVIWKLMTGRDAEEIDHINGNRSDNRIENLREVTRSENLRNQKRRKSNTSGVTGVTWYAANNKWLASIGVNGKSKHIGYFNEFSDAVVARKDAEVKYGYHPNHDR